MTEMSPFDRISPTALAIVYLREGTSIPYTQRIAAATNAEEVVLEKLLGGRMESLAVMRNNFTYWSEVRFRSLSAAIRNRKNVLELAAGFSPRGLMFTEDPEAFYVASDLPNLYQERLAVTRAVRSPLPNLVIANVDATVPEDVLSAVQLFEGRGPVDVVNEGLLFYLTHDEKSLVARNILEFLKRTGGGSWYSTDIHTLEEITLMEKLTKEYIGDLAAATVPNFRDQAFASLDEAEALMNEAGLRVTRGKQHDFVPIGSMTSQMPLRGSDVHRYLEYQNLWNMTIA